MFTLVLATSNLHKIREFKQLLKPLIERLDLYTLRDFKDYVPPEETGTTFEENAILKATTAALALNKWTLADDSGLVVPALNGQPGIFSARYAGIDAKDVENRKKLLTEMQALEGVQRQAYFECTLALSSPSGVTKLVSGKCEGEIALKERGRNGFGYDPLFIKHDYQKTFAELEDEVKNKISHRGKAFSKMNQIIEAQLSLTE